tara:strand:- start:360 stop:974 length:615 start_codon:yes stop_codon:yes gene_type:complete
MKTFREFFQDEETAASEDVVVFVPGSFKPPHKGHYKMVEHYSTMYPQGKVKVLISNPGEKSKRYTAEGKEITPQVAKEIFEFYTNSLHNVEVNISPEASPVGVAFEALKDLEPGTTAVLGASKKLDEKGRPDWYRFKDAQAWAEGKGLDIKLLDPEQTAMEVISDGGVELSAGHIRDNPRDIELLKNYIPDGVNAEDISVILTK